MSTRPRPVHRLVGPILSLAAALLAVVAAALLAVAATDPAHVGPTGSTGPTVVTGPVPVIVVPTALTSTGDLGSYRHDVATVIRIPDPDPNSPTYTPPVCLSRRVLLNSGDYTYGTSFGWQGDAFDRDGVVLHGGFYIWQDCLLASASGGYMQLSRLTMNSSPDDGRHDAAVIFHHRDTPNWRDADANGLFAWGSFLNSTD